MAKASKPAAKPTAKKAVAPASAPAKKVVVKKQMTKSALLAHLAEKAKIKKPEVQAVLDEIIELIKKEVAEDGPGKFVLPGLCRVTVTRKDAVKGGETKKNRLTGADFVTKDKPAYNQVKLRPVKALKTALA